MIVERIGEVLLKKSLTLSTVESCTGGLIGHLITNIPGSSRYYRGGIIAYDNNIKTGIVGVPEKIIKNYGAVSEECAHYMAVGVRERFKTAVSLATTGVAGPGGGTKEKPVGLVYVAVSTATETLSRKFVFNGGREENKNLFSEHALRFLYETLQSYI